MERWRINALSRREFLMESASTAALLGLVATANAQDQTEANKNVKPLRIGIVGPGSQGQMDLGKMLQVPGVTCVAVCDIFEPSLTSAKKIAKVTDENAYTDYRRLLERKDIDAVMVTTPPTFHAKVTIDALNSGKHVFCEKLMASTIEDAKKMVLAARNAKKILQIGHHRASSIGYNHAYELINKKQVCGKITHIRSQWNRNGNWRRGVPKEGKILAETGYWRDAEHLVNWRLYNRTSDGLMGELASHQIYVANWFLNSAPTAVMGVAGVDYWKDGRDVWDNVQCIYEYSGGVKVTYQSLTTNQFDGFQEEFMGDKGTMITTLGDRNMDKGLLYREPKAETLDWAEFTQKEKSAGGKEGMVLNASATKKLSTGAKIGETTLSVSGDGKDAYDLQFHNFAASIREGRPVVCSGEEAFKTTVSILKANEAMEKKTRLVISPDIYKI